MTKDLKRSFSDSRDTKKLRKILHEEIRLGINTDGDSEEEEKVDLRKELYPLGHHINDREEMIEQMFSLIKGEKLRKMLPTILRDMPLDELKADCLIHLLGMSKKRIYAILEGREIGSSSDSETHSDSSIKAKRKELPIVKPIVIKQEGCSDISDNSEEVFLIDPDSCESVIPKSKKKCKKGGKRTKHHEKLEKSKEVRRKKKITKVEDKIEHPTEKQQSNEASDSEIENEEDVIPTGGKNLLEILELEMRARAIRALLHKNGPKDDEHNKSIGETTSSINHSGSDGSAEDSEETEDNKVTPARNIRKRKNTNDDVIVVAPKLVTIDLTDEIDSRLKNKTPQKPGNDHVLPGNVYGKTSVTENDPSDQSNDSGQEPKDDALNDKKDDSILKNKENELKSIILDDNNEEPEDKTHGDKGCEHKPGLSGDKEFELEDGELVAKESDDDHDVIEIQHEENEQGIEDKAPKIDDISVKQTKLDVRESSVNENELLELAETVILSDDDSTLPEYNSVFDKDRTKPIIGQIAENSEEGKATNSGEQIITQSVGECGDITKDTNAKKSWAQRWLESKEVKKVVSTSKLCGSIRKKIKIAKIAKKRSLEENRNEDKQGLTRPPQDIQGSVDEYQLLPKSRTTTVYNTDKHDEAEGECKALQNAISSLNIPSTTDSTPENTSSNEQVQDVTSTENIKILDQSSDSKFNDENNQILQQQQPVINKTNIDKKQNETESTTNSPDQKSVLKMCDSSNTAVEQHNSDASSAILIQNDARLGLGGSNNQNTDMNKESNTYMHISNNDTCDKTKIITAVDTTYNKTLAKQPGPASSKTHLNEMPENDQSVKLQISENISNLLNDVSDELQSTPLVVTSETTNDKGTDEILDPDQNGLETLEINITDEELEIDGIINDIIDPSNQNVVWSKSEILEID